MPNGSMAEIQESESSWDSESASDTHSAASIYDDDGLKIFPKELLLDTIPVWSKRIGGPNDAITVSTMKSTHPKGQALHVIKHWTGSSLSLVSEAFSTDVKHRLNYSHEPIFEPFPLIGMMHDEDGFPGEVFEVPKQQSFRPFMELIRFERSDEVDAVLAVAVLNDTIKNWTEFTNRYRVHHARDHETFRQEYSSDELWLDSLLAFFFDGREGRCCKLVYGGELATASSQDAAISLNKDAIHNVILELNPGHSITCALALEGLWTQRTLPEHIWNANISSTPAIEDDIDYIGFDFTHFRSELYPRPDHTQPALDWTGFLEKDELVGMGSFGDVYKGKWINLLDKALKPPPVAMKIMRGQVVLTDKELRKRLKSLKRELSVWQRLTHPNILPFIGIVGIYGDQPALLSVWMKHGGVKDYLKCNPWIDRYSILRGIASGIEYLHEHDPEIVHGDLKADNVLIDLHGNPCVADFGLSRMMETSSLWNTSATSAGGTTRWQAPELMMGEQAIVTAPADVYAYSMTSLEIMTGRQPFADFRNDAAVIKAVGMDDKRPDRPLSGIPDMLWDIWTACWVREPLQRLTMEQVVAKLKT